MASTHRLPSLARAPSPALVLSAIASVQLGSAVATHLFGAVGPSGAVLLRLASAAVVLMVVTRPGVRGHGRAELWLAAAFGIVLAAMNLSFYAAIDRIPLGIAVTLEFLGPLAVAVAGSRRALDLVWVALAAAGVVALARGGAGHLDSAGVAFALLAACFWALYILLSVRVGRAFTGGGGVALAMVVAAIVAAPLGLAHGGLALLRPRSLALGCAVGLLSSAIPYSFELEALRRLPASLFGVLMSLEPAVAALAGFVVLGQGLRAREVAGIALVVAASAGAARRGGPPPEQV